MTRPYSRRQAKRSGASGAASRVGLPGRDPKAVLHPAYDGHPDAAHLSRKPRVAVVGGGIAGLAAATCLAERGIAVELLERNHYLGGRVGGWHTTLADGSATTMNRGFHAFFRQYYNLRALLKRGDPQLSGLRALTDYPLIHSDGYRDTFAGLPRTPPWNAVAFAARSPTFTLSDIARLSTKAALPLARVSVPETYTQLDHLDAASFLDTIRFPNAAKHLAFEVFSRSFFADPRKLSAAELATMFHIYFLGSSEGLLFDVASDCFPLALWQPLLGHLRTIGAKVHTGVGVQALQYGSQHRFTVAFDDGRSIGVDGVVLATDAGGLRELVHRSPDLADAPWRDRIANVPSAPPFLVSRFWLDRPVRGDRPGFLGTSGFGPLDNISVLERYERSASEWATRNGGSVVELHCYALEAHRTIEELRPDLLAELRRIYPETAAATAIDERHEIRADCPLFPPGGFAERPGVSTPDPYLAVAGDLARIDLPVALMERAATTGMQAANTLLRNWDIHGHALWSVPDRGRFAALRGRQPSR